MEDEDPMKSLRFSMASLMAAIAIVAVGLGSLNSTSRISAGMLFLATIGLLLTAILGTIYRTGESRAFWLGVALFGSFYMFIAFTPWFENAQLALDSPLRALRDSLWTVRVPVGADESVLRDMDTHYDSAARQTLGWPAWHTFRPKAHCLAALLFGLVGGITARWFYSRSVETESQKL